MRTSLILLLCASAAAHGHELYIVPGTFFPSKGATIAIGLHVGDSFPESEIGGRPDRFKDPRLIGLSGSASLRNLRVEGKRNIGDVAVEEAGELIAAVHTVPALIELDPAKFTEYLKEVGLTDVIAWRAGHGESTKPGKERYSKYAKAVLLSGAANRFSSRPVGYAIEIVPETDPYTAKPGDLLPIQVLFRGRPAADLQIESAWAGKGGPKLTVVGRTGPDGRTKVPLPAAGLWRIHTIKMERCAEPSVADWESFWASMTFELR